MLKKIRNWFNYRFRYYIVFNKRKEFKNRLIATIGIKRKGLFKKILFVNTTRKEVYENLELLYNKRYISLKQLKRLEEEIKFLNEEELRFYPFKKVTGIKLGNEIYLVKCPFCLKEKVSLVLEDNENTILFCDKCKRIFDTDEIKIGKKLFTYPT